MIFAAIACFLFTYKGTKENIGLMLFGDDYWKDKSDWNKINLTLSAVIVLSSASLSGLFIVAGIPGLTIIGYIVDLVCPIIFMCFPLLAYYKVKKSPLALAILAINVVFWGFAFVKTVMDLIE